MRSAAKHGDLLTSRLCPRLVLAALASATIVTPAAAIDPGDVFRFGFGAIQEIERQRQQRPRQIQPQRRIEAPREAVPSQKRVQRASREVVLEIQRLLNELGYSAGPVDGQTGPKTRAAIRQFQTDAGIAVDGQPSPLVASTLRASTRFMQRTTTSPSEMPAKRQAEFADLQGYDLPLGDFRTGLDDPSLSGIPLEQCEAECAVDDQCQAFTYNTDRRVCFLKSSVSAPSPVAGAVSGIRVDDQAGIAGAQAAGENSPVPASGEEEFASQTVEDSAAPGVFRETPAEDEREAASPGRSDPVPTNRAGGLVAPALPPATIETAPLPTTPRQATASLQGFDPTAPEGAAIGMTAPEIEGILQGAGYTKTTDRTWERSPGDGKIRIAYDLELCPADSDCPPPLVTRILYSRSGIFVEGTALEIMNLMGSAIGAVPKCPHVEETWGECTWSSPSGAPLVKYVAVSYEISDSDFGVSLHAVDDLRAAVAVHGRPDSTVTSSSPGDAVPEATGSATGTEDDGDGKSIAAGARPGLVAPAPAGAPTDASAPIPDDFEGEQAPGRMPDGPGTGAGIDYVNPAPAGLISLIGRPIGEVEAGLIAAGYENTSGNDWKLIVGEGTKQFYLSVGSCSSSAAECADQPIHQVTYDQDRLDVPVKPIDFVRQLQASIGEPERCDKLEETWAYCRWIKPAGTPGIAFVQLNHEGSYLTVVVQAETDPDLQQRSSVD